MKEGVVLSREQLHMAFNNAIYGLRNMTGLSLEVKVEVEQKKY